MMKLFRNYFTLLVFIMLLTFQELWACAICEENQPKLFKGVVHGTGVQEDWDYYIIGFAILIVIITFFLSLKYVIKPEKNTKEHIKFRIIQNDFYNGR